MTFMISAEKSIGTMPYGMRLNNKCTVHNTKAFPGTVRKPSLAFYNTEAEELTHSLIQPRVPTGPD